MLRSHRVPILTVFLLCLLLFPLTSAVVESSTATSPLQAVTATVLSEDFEGGTLPANWQATGTPGWRFDNPGARANETGASGKFAIADSDIAGQIAMDTILQTPSLDLSAASGVSFSFKTKFLADGTSIGEADVSVDNGATWTNVWRQASNSFTGNVTLGVPQAAGKSNVLFRFHYYNANYA